MNYYIDFDSTLYNTSLLTKTMLDTVVSSIQKQKNIDTHVLEDECKLMFNQEHIYDIYELCKYFANKYSLNPESIINSVKSLISNGNKFIFSDVIPFLKKLKVSGHKVYLLTKATQMQFQSEKVTGANISQYFDSIIITQMPKYELDLHYEKGIFIDDNPEDLLGLYSKNPVKVIRLRRLESKYSIKDIKNTDIIEYNTLSQIPIT